jgi:hypothetical protein
LVFLLAGAVFFGKAPLYAAQADPPIEEDFTYQLRFLFFKQVAKAKLHLQPLSENRYRAELLAETKGLLEFLTGGQKNHYVSEMEYVPSQKRLVTRRFTKTVTTTGEKVSSITEIDYPNKEYRWVATENGEIKDKGSRPIPDGVIFEDLLSVLFNLRRGALGPLKPGRRIQVSSLPYYQATAEGETRYGQAHVETFEIRIANPTTEEAYRKRFERQDEKGLLVVVKVPRALFGQKNGEVLVWLDQKGIPTAARVEDVVLFGDVAGDLERPSTSKEEG